MKNLLFAIVAASMLQAGQYTVLAPLVKDNLSVFPVVGPVVERPEPEADTLVTLDEGLRTGEVVVKEIGSGVLQRTRRTFPPGTFPGDFPNRGGARVNQLALYVNSSRPLLLLAGEIVTGGKQDRVVGQDRIVPAHSGPVDLGVFCVEPHRWTEVSATFGGLSFMAQPGVRRKAVFAHDQQAVWDQVASSRKELSISVSAAAPAIAASSSYASAVNSKAVRDRLAHYDSLIARMQDQTALGVVVALNGELVWADVFASPALFEKYWPKLIRSYAAEAMQTTSRKTAVQGPTIPDALAFLRNLAAVREKSEAEPGVFRNTQMTGSDFEAFILTSLLPGKEYQVHLAKMKKD